MKSSLINKVTSFALAVLMVIGILPITSFAVETDSKKVIQVYSESLITSMEVPIGTALEELGLPSELDVQVEIATEDSVTAVADEKAAVNWQGDYSSEQVGTYELRAVFADGSYNYAGDMPTVLVNVIEEAPMLLAETPNEPANGMINLIDINAITSSLLEVRTAGSSNFVELPLPEGTELHVGDEVHIKFQYTELDNVYPSNVYYFDIPTGLSAISGQSRGDIESDGQVIGSYWVEDNKVKMQFTDEEYLQETDNTVLEGFVNFYATLNQDAVDQQGVIRLGNTVIGTVSYEKNGEEAEGIVFANTYTAPTGASQVFNGSKTLTEGGQPKTITAGQFKFTVAAGENNPAEITGLPTGEISVGADGSFALGTLSFTKAGTYTFIVSEVNGGAAGYSYDDKAVTVTVPVTLNEETNTLEIGTVSYEKNGEEAEGIVFANTYTAPTGASQVFNGSKTLTEGGQPKTITAGQFKFTVAAGENNPAEITGLPTGEISVGADGSFALGTLSFTKAGTYTFIVSEVNGGAAGYSYDDKAVTVTVPVTLNEETNTLEIGTVSYEKNGEEAEGIVFANTYTAPTGASQVFNGSKTLTEGGQPKTITAGQFKFTVAAGENNPAEITGLPTGEISVGADGSFALGTLSFTKAGTYTFIVSEVNGGAAGYSYDDKAVTVTVPVTLNEETNTLEIGTVSYEKNGEEAEGIVFANTYTAPTGASQVFNGSKTLTEGGQPKTITAGQFKFTVAAGENNPAEITGLPTGEISVGADGSFALGTLSFTKAGTYTFIVSEVNGGAAGYSYDDKAVTVTVPVTLNEETNTLEIGTVSYEKNGEEAEGIVFANTYTAPTGASQVFNGSKTLTEGGQPKTITAGQFKFTVAAGENNPAEITGLPTGEISVGADGSFALGTLSFTKAGTYTFIVSEVNGGAAGYSYDDKAVTVTVPVTLNEETNTLEIGTVSYEKNGEEAEGIVFANTYTRPGGGSNDDPTPGNNPQTGDTSNLPLWMTLLILSGIGITSTAFFGKRKKSQPKHKN